MCNRTSQRGKLSQLPIDRTNHGAIVCPMRTQATVAVALLLGLGCTQEKPITSPFSDTFDRADVGDNYYNTGGPYQIVNRKLRVKGAYNKPLWLKRPLPSSAIIEVDVTSGSASGDIKVEAWGDGKSAATSRGAYMATSYVFLFGGWNNQISALVRMDEHAKDRSERRDIKVERNKTYHWTITRRGTQITWEIDGKPFLQMNDSAPLRGKHHAYFAFNNWESDVVFDNLSIKPL